MRSLKLLLVIISLLVSVNAFAQDKANKTETAIFAGGCFWCMHAAFEELPDVTKVTSGYTGGHVKDPTYEQVSSGTTGHIESIEVAFDPAKVTYGKLLEWFWDNVDPTDAEGQFCDKGTQYAAGIFFTTPEQKTAAEASLKAKQAKFDKPLTAFIRSAEAFYPAEDYHQSYYKKNKLQYTLYKAGCGREHDLNKIWKK